jgi:hypothetical protein
MVSLGGKNTLIIVAVGLIALSIILYYSQIARQTFKNYVVAIGLGGLITVLGTMAVPEVRKYLVNPLYLIVISIVLGYVIQAVFTIQVASIVRMVFGG